MNKKLDLKIEIPEIDQNVFDKNIIDGVPIIKKNIKKINLNKFWEDYDLNDKKNLNKNNNYISN